MENSSFETHHVIKPEIVFLIIIILMQAFVSTFLMNYATVSKHRQMNFLMNRYMIQWYILHLSILQMSSLSCIYYHTGTALSWCLLLVSRAGSVRGFNILTYWLYLNIQISITAQAEDNAIIKVMEGRTKMIIIYPLWHLFRSCNCWAWDDGLWLRQTHSDLLTCLSKTGPIQDQN